MKEKKKTNHASKLVPQIDGAEKLEILLEFFTLLSRLDKAHA